MRRLLLLLTLLVLAGCGGSDEKPAEPESGVRELANVLELRADFEADTGKTRLLLLFSPT